jgi:tetratricopeptide (TPR) repeat protein
LDTVLFSGTLKISDALFNRGLACAKASDLSGAIENLSKSVQINKNNVFARNLLGLVLFETGRVGEALKEWVISQSLMKDRNPAVLYLDDIKNNGRVLEIYNNAIKMYNNALGYIRQKSDDIAIIQLKKAVECNPRFIDAFNLLTLCYLIQQDRDRASMTVDRVLAIDPNNTIALNYYHLLNPSRNRPDTRIKKTPISVKSVQNEPQRQAAPVVQPPRTPIHDKKRNNFHIAEILSFIIGAACMFTAIYFLVIPAVSRGNELELDVYKTQFESFQREYLAEIDEKDNVINALRVQIDEFESNNNFQQTALDVEKKKNQILHAYSLYSDHRYQEALDIVLQLDVNGLPFDIREMAGEIIDVSRPLLAKEYFDDGIRAQQDNDLAKARVDFEKSDRYSDESSPHFDDMIYHLGILYAADPAKKDQAIGLLELFLNRNPNHSRTESIQVLMNELSSP